MNGKVQSTQTKILKTYGIIDITDIIKLKKKGNKKYGKSNKTEKKGIFRINRRPVYY